MGTVIANNYARNLGKFPIDSAGQCAEACRRRIKTSDVVNIEFNGEMDFPARYFKALLMDLLDFGERFHFDLTFATDRTCKNYQ
jgi:hypothetical protein